MTSGILVTSILKLDPHDLHDMYFTSTLPTKHGTNCTVCLKLLLITDSVISNTHHCEWMYK